MNYFEDRPWRKVVKSDGWVDQLECGHTWSNIQSPNKMSKIAKRHRCGPCAFDARREKESK